MANIAIFASGNGSNFEAFVEYFKNDKNNQIKILICDRKKAYVIDRAIKHNIPFFLVNYLKNEKSFVENQILEFLQTNKIHVIFLAGFMRILSENFIIKCSIPIINIHPSILPKYKGTDAIERAFYSDDLETGITIHYVNEKVDEGEIIVQKKIKMNKELGLEETKKAVHLLEHKWYPKIAKKICDNL